VSDSDVVSTRRQLHAIAENLIAGPQYRAAGTIRLAVRPDGFTGTALPILRRDGIDGARSAAPCGRDFLAGPEYGPPGCAPNGGRPIRATRGIGRAALAAPV